jgi:uncharacterized protein involved in outer membrane biogenesis
LACWCSPGRSCSSPRAASCKHSFERIVAGQTHRDVKVEGDFQLYFNPINVKFLAERIHVANPDWAGKGNFFEAKKIDSRISTWSLITGKRRVNWLSLENGQVDLQWDKAGKRNTWTFSEEKGEPLDLPIIRRALVQGTMIRYVDPRMQIEAGIRVHTVEARDTAIRLHHPLRRQRHRARHPLRAERRAAHPQCHRLGRQEPAPAPCRGRAHPVDITGTLPGATEIEGADLHMDVRGQNLADIFMLAGIAVPDTRTYRLRSALTKLGDEWRFTGLKGRFGDSDIAGKMVVKMTRPRLLLTAELATDTLDIVDAGPFIGYNPNTLAARGAAGAVTQVAGTPRILPDAKLRVEALRNFDAKVHWTVRDVRAPSFPVSHIELGLDLDNMLLKLSPLNFSMARGTVSSDIIINARQQPVFTDYDIRLSPTPMGTLLAGFGVEESGTSGTVKARVKMTGTGDSVRESLANSNGRIAIILPRGSMWARNIQLSELDIGTFLQKMFEKKLKEPVQINCGLIGFTVRNGIAAADPDPDRYAGRASSLGRGGFSFKNEAVDLAFERRCQEVQHDLAASRPWGSTAISRAPKIDVISPRADRARRCGGSRPRAWSPVRWLR